MKINTVELTGAALDWAVEISKYGPKMGRSAPATSPSTDWAIAGPIIERENISIVRCNDTFHYDSGFPNFPGAWLAERGAQSYECSTQGECHEPMIQISVQDNGGRFAKDGPFYGPTPLVAAMRCYVAASMGMVIEVPDALAPRISPAEEMSDTLSVSGPAP